MESQVKKTISTKSATNSVHKNNFTKINYYSIRLCLYIHTSNLTHDEFMDC